MNDLMTHYTAAPDTAHVQIYHVLFRKTRSRLTEYSFIMNDPAEHFSADMKEMETDIGVRVKVQARHFSVAWKYFLKNENKGTVYCRLCNSTFKFSSNTANMIRHLRIKHSLCIPSGASGDQRPGTEQLQEEAAAEMDLPPQRHHGLHSSPNIHRIYRYIPFPDRRKSKVWNHYTQVNHTSVECNHCKRQYSFHNSTTSMREHLGRKHGIREDSLQPSNIAGISSPAGLHSHILQGNLGNNSDIQPALPLNIKEELEEVLPEEMGEATATMNTYTPDKAPGSGTLGSDGTAQQETDMECLMYNFSTEEIGATGGGSRTCIGSKACSNKRAEVLTDLILGMVCRDLQPLSVVEESGFKLLLSCLEPNFPIPSQTLLGNILWQRHQFLKQCLQDRLKSSLASNSLNLCAEYWRSVEGCGVDGVGQYYLTVSAHFVDYHWQRTSYVLETRPIAELKVKPSVMRQPSFADVLRAVLSEFQLPEKCVFCVVYDTPSRSKSREQDQIITDKEFQQEFPDGWVSMLCAGQALKLCVEAAISIETVQKAIADARAIVLHFQHNYSASAALHLKADAVNKVSACLVLNDPGRWTTAIEMCESLLELKWVISSVLEEQKASTNLADHQWRLLHELVPVLKTVRIAASFLSEDINGSISALMPCLQGVSRLLGQKIAECTCPVVRGVMERIRTRMDEHWSLSDEDALLDCPAVLSSFLDPRFKELQFLSPHARSKLHNKIKEMLSSQAFTSGEGLIEGRRQSMEMEEALGENGQPTEFDLDDSLLIPPMSSLDSPESCGSVGEGEIVELQPSEPSFALSSPEQVNENGIVGPPFRNSKEHKRWSSGTTIASPPGENLQLTSRTRLSPIPQSMYDILLGEDPTERMPEIQRQLENYIAEPLCRRSLSPLQWWRNKEHRFPAVARLARKYLSIPATAVSASQAFAPKESTITQRRATLGSNYLNQILFLHQNADSLDQLKGCSSACDIDQCNSISRNQIRESLYQTPASSESKAPEEEL
ncbi:hypothetical protein DNTS_008120 [Danionella cerebrum]|uniref:BED-type domain-containing protein n=1 Tax=Danionella cerebrum TaxID=2873325 RepID=A0A553N382_9TELE|nr:hypothetical protein DNTS_008120 [Danionella translucida]